MDYNVLKAEIAGDPEGLGYSGMTDQQVADSLNIVNRERNRTSMTGTEILNQVDAAEWAGLTDVQQRTVWDIVHLGEVNPFGIEAALLTDVFTAESTTITALKAARTIAVSRATEIGLGVSTVYAGHVQNARAM